MNMYPYMYQMHTKKLTVLSKNKGLAIIAPFTILNNNQDLMNNSSGKCINMQLRIHRFNSTKIFLKK